MIALQTVYALYFSATGTTEKIVMRVANNLGGALHLPVSTVDFTLPAMRGQVAAFGPSDIVVCGTPVYAGRVPNVLLPYLHDMLHGHGALAVPIVLYGNRNYDDALIELRNLLEEGGFHTIAGGAFIGEHAFSKVLAAGRPDAEDLAIADSFANEISACVQSLQEAPTAPVMVKGETPLRPYYTPRDRQGNPVNILKVKPKTRDTCTQCGICAAACPMGTISRQDAKEMNGICIKCGACIKKCPINAKYYDDERYLYHQHELEEGFARRAEPETFILKG